MLTNTERQQIVEEVNAGTYGIDEALDDIAAAQKGEEVRKALYAEALVLNREGHAGSTDMIARQQIANLQTSVNGQISTLRTEVGEDIGDLETALNSGLAAQNGRIAAQNATIANVVANYNVEYGSTELWASTGETGALAAGTTVTLSEDVSHFDYIDIYSFLGNNNILDTLPVDTKLQSNEGYALRWVNLSDPGSGTYDAYVRIIETKIKIIGTTLTIIHQVTYSNGASVSISGAEITSSNRSTYVGELGIMKIVGRKITANTEVEDIRTGADGTEYNSAGQAVRAQVTALESAIPAVDSTLSTQGAAADAKAVGDALADVSGDSENIAYSNTDSGLLATNVQDAIDETALGVSTNTAKIGDLNQLITVEKDTLVGAINEAATSGDPIAPLDVLCLYGSESEIQTNWNNRSKAKMRFRYVFVHSDTKEQKNGWCYLKLQGQTSIVAPKHNFNVQFFKDDEYRNKDKTNYYDFGKHPKFTIKANYIDYSQARNIVSARLWGDIVHSRVDMRNELSDAPNHGAVDGHPIILYLNDAYYGLYTFNMPKEDWMLGLDEDNPMTIAVGAENGGNACLFKEVSSSQWTVEVPDTWTSYTPEGETEAVSSYTNFLAMMDFVVNSTDADFVANISNHFNLPSLIDYYIYSYCVCNADTFNKNQLMCSWDCGQTWYFTAYDMDETFGITLTGSANYNNDPLVTYDNRLFKRLETLFAEDIYDRYVVLRNSVLSDSYMKREFELFFSLFPNGERERDKNLWTGMSNASRSTLEFFNQFIEDRMRWCDNKFERMNPDFVACTGVALSANAISFDDVSATHTLTATLSPSNTTESLTWTSSNPAIATVSNGVVVSVADGECTITATCGEYSATCTVTVDLIQAPAGYTLLPSLKINNAYFDSGVMQNGDTGFAIKYDASTTTVSPVYGVYIISNYNSSASTINHAGVSTWYWFGASTTVLPNGGGGYANGVHKIELRGGTELYIDDTYIKDINRGTSTPQYSFLVFSDRYSNGNARQNNWNGRTCYWLKIYDGTTLIRHYVPVMRDADSVLGFYDLINDTFKTAAGGSFSQ